MPQPNEKGAGALHERLNFFATNLLHAGDAAGDPLLGTKVAATCNKASAWLIDDLRPALFELEAALTKAIKPLTDHANDTLAEGYPELAREILAVRDDALAALSRATPVVKD